jgi:nitrate reductase NapE component
MLQDAFEVMLLPRRVRRRWRLMGLFLCFAWALWAGIGRQIKPHCERERFLSLFGPISMVGLFSIWAIGLMAGFGLVFWSLERHLPNHYDLGSYLYMSGTTLVTLGYGDFTPHAVSAKAIAVAEAATGFGLLAVMISYLPVLYQLFSRRETYVMQLDGRAGSPPTAGVLLGRHASNQALHKLDDLLLDWEKWCAELVESHLSYPMLSFYRSQHANQNWLTALAAITDCCVIVMVGLKDVPAFQAKMTFAMARLAMVELCRVFHLSPIPHPEDRIGRDEFQALNAELSASGLAWVDSGAADGKVAEFDATYEPFLQALARFLIIDLPSVTPGSGNGLDNWQRSVRGRSAKSLVEQARSGTDPLRS